MKKTTIVGNNDTPGFSHVFGLFDVLFIVKFNDDLRPFLRADDGSWNGSETF